MLQVTMMLLPLIVVNGAETLGWSGTSGSLAANIV
jgi:hypothetical protein